MSFIQNCSSCPNATDYRAISGDGPQPASILCIAERPGQDENRYGRVLCGKTGQEFDEVYLPLAGLHRSEIRVCNTVLCGSDNNKAPGPKDIAACSRYHLGSEIEQTEPSLIILMGSTACSLLPRIALDRMHGIPQHTNQTGKLFGWSGWVIPMYHPSMGLHESRWMKILMDDWANLNTETSSTSAAPPSTIEPVDYRVWQDGYIPNVATHPIGIDTETHDGRPWSVQVSFAPGTAVLVPVDNPDGIRWLRHCFQASMTTVAMHNASFDLEILRQLDIHIDQSCLRDTMQEAFHLGNQPQGLKSLVYRLFRHTMSGYEMTVHPASIHRLMDWMMEAYLLAQTDLSFIEQKKMKTKTKEIVHAGPAEKLLHRLITNTKETSDYDPWVRLSEFWTDPETEWMAEYIESRIGPYPRQGIANCTIGQAVQYACGDADWTGRLATKLTELRFGAFHIDDGDIDDSDA